MNLETARERLDRGQKSLLQTDDEKTRRRLCAARTARKTLLAQRAVLIEQAGEHEFRGILRKPLDRDSHDLPLGTPPCTVRMSSFKRRTITASSAFGRNFTPRVKREFPVRVRNSA